MKIILRIICIIAIPVAVALMPIDLLFKLLRWILTGKMFDEFWCIQIIEKMQYL
jgi:hypothetical protein